VKARITLLATILLATVSTISYAEANGKSNVDCAEIAKNFSEILDEKDSIKVFNLIIAKTNDSLKQLISDNITAQDMIKSNEFYSNAFDKILISFSIFLGFVAILSGFSVYNHFKIIREFNKYDKVLSEIDNKIKQEVNVLKQEIRLEAEKQKDELKEEKDGISRKIGIVYFTGAIAFVKNDDWMMHFTYLSRYCNFVVDNKIELKGLELDCFNQLYGYINQFYKGIDPSSVDSFLYKYTQRYLFALEQLITYCKEMDKPEHLAVVKKLYEELDDVFDSINQKSPTTGDPS
jgi:hypothetical protein